jgi:hypothetical protein
MNLDVGEKAKQRAATISSSPSMREIEASIARLRQSLWKIADKFAPDLLGAELSNPGTRDRFYVSSDAFLDPVMLISNAWECQMHHLVGNHPIHCEVGLGRAATDGDSDEASVMCAIGCSRFYFISGYRSDLHNHMSHWKTTIIFGHCSRCSLNPGEKRALRNAGFFRLEGHIDSAPADHDLSVGR